MGTFSNHNVIKQQFFIREALSVISSIVVGSFILWFGYGDEIGLSWNMLLFGLFFLHIDQYCLAKLFVSIWCWHYLYVV